MGNVASNKLGNNGGRSYSFLNRPVLIDCNFVVDATNANGLGIRALKGAGVADAFMVTSASFVGSVTSGSNAVTAISSTANLKVGMLIVSGTNIPIGSTIIAITSSTAILISQNATGSSAGITISYVGQGQSGSYNMLLNSNIATTSRGYAWIRLANNYNRYTGGFAGYASPVTGSNIQIDSTTAGLTAGKPYVITAVGRAAAGAAQIVAVADTAGSLASKYFNLYDSYGNNWLIWFYVTGIGGAAPVGVAGIQTQVTIASGSTAAQVATALSGVIALLVPPAVAGVFSFTTSVSTATVTATNTSTRVHRLPGPPQDGASPLATGFTFSLSVNDSNAADWRGVGLPIGVTAAVGAGFIATTTGFGASNGTVKAVGISGVSAIEVVGDPNSSIGTAPVGGSSNVGGWILVQFLAPTSSSVTTLIPTAPANETVIGLSFYVEAASILIAGE